MSMDKMTQKKIKIIKMNYKILNKLVKKIYQMSLNQTIMKKKMERK